MRNDNPELVEEFLQKIGLNEGEFTRVGFGEYWDWYRASSGSTEAAYGEVRHAYSLVQGPPYTVAALEAVRRRFGKLIEGDAYAGEELLTILDKSRPQVCWFLFEACCTGRINSHAFARAFRRLIDLGSGIETLKDSGRSREEIAAMFVQAGPHCVMSGAESNALRELPEEMRVYRGDVGKTPADMGSEMSWSLSRDVGLLQAERRAGERGRLAQLWQAKVARDDVLAYLRDRGEHELIVRPDRLKQAECQLTERFMV